MAARDASSGVAPEEIAWAKIAAQRRRLYFLVISLTTCSFQELEAV
jgi:hypothetical protein